MLPTRFLLGFGMASLAVLLTAPAARAQDSAVSAAPLARPAQAPLPRLGLMVGAGIPDGATGSLVYRPFKWLRAEAGGSYNMISKGVRGGLSVIPFGMGPSATLEAGHYFDGNANGIARSIAGGGFQDNAILQRVGYDFANAHLGLDFGVKRVVFFIHGGMSYVRANIRNVNAEIASNMSSGTTGSSGGTTVSFNQDPVVRIFTPSVKLGFVLYIW
ncbi:MAG: hypothetical protein ABUS79_29630 [Pseudomonadota bacterium]